jgi:hypothetical protein
MEYPLFISKFLASVDRENNELYILHREDPQYLIWVKQETPMRFILIEYYDQNFTAEEILAHSSLSEARVYAKNLLESGFDLN